MTWGATIVGYQVGVGILLSVIVGLIFLVPFWAASSRRLHDTGRSGWWILLTVTVVGAIPIIFWWASIGKPDAVRDANSLVARGLENERIRSYQSRGTSEYSSALAHENEQQKKSESRESSINAAVEAMKKALEASRWR